MATIQEPLNVVYVPIDTLRPAEKNPRVWSKEAIEQLKESITRHGVVDPLLANSAPGREGVVIGGHMRLKVLKELGFTDVPVVHLNIPDIEKERELLVRLNKNTGDWNWDMLTDFGEAFLADIGF